MHLSSLGLPNYGQGEIEISPHIHLTDNTKNIITEYTVTDRTCVMYSGSYHFRYCSSISSHVPGAQWVNRSCKIKEIETLSHQMELHMMCSVNGYY